MPLGRLLLRTSAVNKIVSRNAYRAVKPNYTEPNKLTVGLTFGTTAFLWILLFKQHSDDVKEYKRRKGLE